MATHKAPGPCFREPSDEVELVANEPLNGGVPKYMHLEQGGTLVKRGAQSWSAQKRWLEP